ncbi:hypothetical protein ACEPAG_4151 [Sanghuangporus baumii]
MSSASFKVSYPFDGSNGTHSDLILRSADGVDFKVMKAVLAVASPVFHDMTTLAEPLLVSSEGQCNASAEVSEEGFPIVVMYESNAIVLDALLRMIYPVVPPKLEDGNLELVSGILRAAQKYDMAAVMHVVEHVLRAAAHRNSGERSLEVFIIACEYRMEELTRLAVNEFLKYPDRTGYFSGLERASASTLFRLYDYKRRVVDEMDNLFSPLKKCLPPQLRCIARDIECSVMNVKPIEGCGSHEAGYYMSSWWITLRESVRIKIQKAPLSEAAITTGLIAEAVYSSKCCSGCREKVLRQVTLLEAAIKSEMRRLAAEVKFELPW